MRHECECDHNARNIHLQDTVKLFGDPDAEAGTDERRMYEKYKDIERNVQNAIELLSGKADMTAQELEQVIEETKEKLASLYSVIPDLSRYMTATVNGYYITYPQIVILKQSDYNNLSLQQKLDSKKIYLICDIDTSTDPMLNSEIIYQRSIFIRGSARGLDYANNDYSANTIELFPIRRTGQLFSTRDLSILSSLFLATQSFNGDAEKAIEQVKNSGDWTVADRQLMDDWESYLSLLTKFDMDIFTAFQEKYGDTIYTTDEDAGAIWTQGLEEIDKIGFWQTMDFNQDGKINASDANLVLRYAAAKGTGTAETNPEYAEILKWDNCISRENAVDYKAFPFKEKGINANIASLILRYAAFAGTQAISDSFDCLKAFVVREL